MSDITMFIYLNWVKKGLSDYFNFTLPFIIYIGITIFPDFSERRNAKTDTTIKKKQTPKLYVLKLEIIFTCNFKKVIEVFGAKSTCNDNIASFY